MSGESQETALSSRVEEPIVKSLVVRLTAGSLGDIMICLSGIVDVENVRDIVH